MNIDTDLARQLILDQMPQWAGLDIRAVSKSGWDNRTFHLGNDKSIRMPSHEGYAPQVGKEQEWLPKLAPSLPFAIPEPIALGQPGRNYPWTWSVYRWINGDTASVNNIANMADFAVQLAQFISALHTIDASSGPPAGSHNFYRGGPLSTYDGEVRNSLDVLGASIEQSKMRSIWTRAMQTEWSKPPVWVHGDVTNENLLVGDGVLVAVIDFGCLGVGDPACDLAIAWTFFDADSRSTFQQALALDQDTWARGRAWALWKALITLAKLPGTDQSKVDLAQRTVNQVLSDFDSLNENS